MSGGENSDIGTNAATKSDTVEASCTGRRGSHHIQLKEGICPGPTALGGRKRHNIVQKISETDCRTEKNRTRVRKGGK